MDARGLQRVGETHRRQEVDIGPVCGAERSSVTA
jgi:hypothetical protein